MELHTCGTSCKPREKHTPELSSLEHCVKIAPGLCSLERCVTIAVGVLFVTICDKAIMVVFLCVRKAWSIFFRQNSLQIFFH